MGDKSAPMLSVLFDEFYLNSTESIVKNEFTLCADETQVFLNGSLPNVVRFINSSLNSTRKRKEGGVLLCSLIPQCPSDVFQQQADTWAKLLLKAIQSFDPIETQEVNCHGMCRLLNSSTAFPELSRKFSNDIIPPLLTRLLDFPPTWRKLAIGVIVCCIKNFPGPCGLMRKKIEIFITDSLNSKDDKTLVDLASKSFVYLARCGGPGNKFSKYTEAWSMYFRKVLCFLKLSLDELYGFVEASTEKEDQKEVPDDFIEFIDVSKDEPLRTINMKSRIFAICKILESMFSADFPGPVNVPLDEIVSVICRMTAVSPQFLLSRPTADRIRLASAISFIHMYSLNLLQSLIRFVGSNMITVGATINQLFVQKLTWINQMQSDKHYGYTSPYNRVSAVLWETIYVWILHLGSSSGIDAIADDVIKYALLQVKQESDSEFANKEISQVKLAEVSDLFHNKKKKGKKFSSGMDSSSQVLSSQRLAKKFANWELHVSAWKVVHEILLKVGPFIKPSSYQAINTVILPLLANLPISVQIPYEHPECLVAVFSVLLSGIQSTHSSNPSPTQIAVGLFARGLTSQHSAVKNICQQGLSVCESIIHPRAPSLQQANVMQANSDDAANTKITQSDVYVIPSRVSNNSLEEKHNGISTDQSLVIQKNNDTKMQNKEDQADVKIGSEKKIIEQHPQFEESETSEKYEDNAVDMIAQSNLNEDSESVGSSDNITDLPSCSDIHIKDATMSDDASSEKVPQHSDSSDSGEIIQTHQKTTKRKFEDDEDTHSHSKMACPEKSSEDVELMMDAFVPAGPDSD